VYAHPPFIAARNELAHQAVTQLPEASNAAYRDAIEPFLSDPFSGRWEVPTVGRVTYVLSMHLGFVPSEMLLWVSGPTVQLYVKNFHCPLSWGVPDFATQGRNEMHGGMVRGHPG